MTRRMMIIFYSIMAGHILFACVIVFFVKPVPAENSLNLKKSHQHPGCCIGCSHYAGILVVSAAGNKDRFLR